MSKKSGKGKYDLPVRGVKGVPSLEDNLSRGDICYIPERFSGLSLQFSANTWKMCSDSTQDNAKQQKKMH